MVGQNSAGSKAERLCHLLAKTKSYIRSYKSYGYNHTIGYFLSGKFNNSTEQVHGQNIMRAKMNPNAISISYVPAGLLCNIVFPWVFTLVPTPESLKTELFRKHGTSSIFYTYVEKERQMIKKY